MDGPGSNTLQAGTHTDEGSSRLGTLVGPLVLVPFIVQLDACLVRKEWYQFNAFALGLAALGAIFILALRGYPRELAAVLRDAQGLLACIIALAVIALFGATLPDANFDEGGKYLYYPTADAILFALSLCASVVCFRERTWRLSMCVAMGLMVASILIDSFRPGTFSELTTRAAGFGVNPNNGGAIVGMLLIGLLRWEEAGFTFFAIAAFAISGMGTFLTLSRSALLCWGVVVGAYFIRTLIRRGTSSWLAIGAIAAPIMFFAASAGNWARETFPMLQKSHERIEAFLGGAEMDHADDSRVHLAEDYFAMALERPWIGWGTGLNYALELGAHNIYLAKWVENGIVALACLLLALVATFRLGARNHDPEPKVIAMFLFIQGFFSHNMLEDKTVLLMWGILCGRAALKGRLRRQQKREAELARVAAIPVRRRRPLPRLTADAA
jgi:O-antigen ligase